MTEESLREEEHALYTRMAEIELMIKSLKSERDTIVDRIDEIWRQIP